MHEITAITRRSENFRWRVYFDFLSTTFTLSCKQNNKNVASSHNWLIFAKNNLNKNIAPLVIQLEHKFTLALPLQLHSDFYEPHNNLTNAIKLDWSSAEVFFVVFSPLPSLNLIASNNSFYYYL